MLFVVVVLMFSCFKTRNLKNWENTHVENRRSENAMKIHPNENIQHTNKEQQHDTT